MSADVVETATEVAPTPRRYATVHTGKRPMSRAQVEGIAARIAYYELPWWRRWLAPRPPEWVW